jgi:5-methylcytosine-specific restriction endonuclease McrA
MPSRAEYMRQWRAANREKSRANERACYARHAEKRRQEKRDYYQKVRKLRDATPKGRLKDLNRKHRRRSLTGAGNVTAEQWAAILAKHNHRCAYCQTSETPLEMDHVIPLSRGGPHCASNIVPACKPCNSAKGAR